ncbi:phosphatase inhibitor-domain-containing protein [Crepidotus variabilis]|uniref:Type 1 phosphatases regulator n=1 Tax=Crepidotus variabilis TaxID=179855 RepID=A0A9P6ERF5_9AGAR|nr:phosphatase inhibitor-domain-containing protein [Crepidotus variabilis]
MNTATQRRPNTYGASDGSRTQIITSNPTEEGGNEGSGSGGENVVGSLRLRGAPRRTQRVVWSEDVIDNEGCGKKKSKICCIYHKPRQFDESSSEESSDSDSDSDCGHAHRCSARRHDHSALGDGSGGQLQASGSSSVVGIVNDAEVEPNAYEKQPPSKKEKQRAT